MFRLMSSVAGPTTICFWASFVPAVLSAYSSSSSGVIMPMFLPMTPGLVELTGGDADFHHFRNRRRLPPGRYFSALHSGRTVHCFCSVKYEDKGVLFRKLLIWGLSMSIVSGIVCYRILRYYLVSKNNKNS